MPASGAGKDGDRDVASPARGKSPLPLARADAEPKQCTPSPAVGAMCTPSNPQRAVNWNSFLAETKGAVPPPIALPVRKDSKVRPLVLPLCLL